MGVESRRIAILDSVQTELLKGAFVPLDNTLAGCDDVLDEHSFGRTEEMQIEEEGDDDEKTRKQPVDVKFV